MNPFPLTSQHRLHAVVPALLMGIAALFLASCGSSSSDGQDATEQTDGGQPDDQAPSEEGETPDEEEASEGSGSGTVTLSDGTVYEIVDMSSCDTSSTNPSALPLDTGYELIGTTADGTVSVNITRAGLSDDDAFFGGSLEGDDPTMTYAAQADSVDITVDGAQTSGSVEARSVGATDPHGEDTVLTLDFTC